MIPLFKHNYIKPSGNSSNFKIDIAPLTTAFDNFYVESCRIAEELYSLKQGKLHILYSGGLDSEYCLSVFLALGIDVTPVILKLTPGYNDYDTKYAFDFCKAKNLTPVVLDLDFDQFVSSGKILDITKQMQCSTFGRASTAWAAGQLDGTVILGDSDGYLRIDPQSKEWYFEIPEHDYSVYRYFQQNGIHGTTSFITWSAEALAAWLSDARILELVNNEHPGKLSTNTSKHIIYNRHSNFDLQVRPKFHGFERIAIDNKFTQSPVFLEMKEFGKSYNGIWRKRYQDLMADFIKQDN